MRGRLAFRAIEYVAKPSFDPAALRPAPKMLANGQTAEDTFRATIDDLRVLQLAEDLASQDKHDAGLVELARRGNECDFGGLFGLPLSGVITMLMHNPPHPGATLPEDVLPHFGLSVTSVAEDLGVTRAALSRVLNEHAAVSPEMALRLEKWLGPENGGSADAWLAQQAAYDLWHTRKAAAAKIKKIKKYEGEHALAADCM